MLHPMKYLPDDITTYAIVTVITLGAILLVSRFLKRRQYKLPPGPRHLPFVGSIRDVSVNRPYVHFSGELRRKYGDVIQLYIGSWTPAVVVNDYEIAVQALVDKYPKELAGRPKSHLFKVFMENCNDIVSADYGPRWKRHRQIVHSALQKFANGRKLEANTARAFHRFAEYVSGHPQLGRDGFEPYDIVHWLTYNIMCSAVYGKEYEREDAEYRWLRDTLEEANKIFVERAIIDFIPGAKYIPHSSLNRVKHLAQNVANFMQKQVDSHRTEKTSPPHDITDFILLEQLNENHSSGDDCPHLEDVHIRQTLLNLISAGADTTALTLVWMLGLLASHPNVQEQVNKEVMQHAAAIDKGQKLELIDKLPYTNAVLHEVLRFSLINPLSLMHKALADCKIGGFDVPKDTWVIFNQYFFNNDPTYWKQPEKFDPSRFLDSNGEFAPKKMGFMPFGCGKRVCLGEVVAKSDLFILLVLFCRTYRLIWSNQNKEKYVKEADDCKFIRLPERFKIKIENR